MSRLFVMGFVLMGAFFGGYKVQDAAEAYERGNFAEAYRLYQEGKDELSSLEANPYIHFDMGMSTLNMDSVHLAIRHFSTASANGPDWLRSQAFNNEGVLRTATSKKQLNQADMERLLEYFREALRANPDNQVARFNYELFLNQPPTQNQAPDSSQNQQNQQDQQQPQQGDPQPGQSPKPKQENPQNSQQPQGQDEDLHDRSNAEDQLEALRKREQQFVQQLRKNNPHRNRQDSSPQW